MLGDSGARFVRLERNLHRNYLRLSQQLEMLAREGFTEDA
jgi:hypothetical protein